MKMYRAISLLFAGIFAVTGILFLLVPGSVLSLFNTLSSWWGMAQTPTAGFTFYLILAVGYMYLVTLLAYLMFRHPGNPTFSFLLANAKLASSLLSLALFLFQDHYLIYLANFVVDGLIGITVLVIRSNAKKAVWAPS